MRYRWTKYDEYFSKGRAGFFTRAAMQLVVRPMRRWDRATASNPHYFVATCENVRQRIREIYDRDSAVIYPPVSTAMFAPLHREGSYFLMVSALVPYKRVDLAIDAFNRSGDRLVIVGTGPDERALKALARPNISFEGWRSDEELREYYAGCRALIFPGDEDFGIVPLEAMSAGKAVLAYARGGALETMSVTPGLKTGIFFYQQTADDLLQGLEQLKNTHFDPVAIRRHALAFDRENFKARIKEFCLSRWRTFADGSSEALMPEQVIAAVR